MARKKYLKYGDMVYATGVFLKFVGTKNKMSRWIVSEFDGDTFRDGNEIQDIDSRPYTEPDAPGGFEKWQQKQQCSK